MRKDTDIENAKLAEVDNIPSASLWCLPSNQDPEEMVASDGAQKQKRPSLYGTELMKAD
jgi:hypothetical protein